MTQAAGITILCWHDEWVNALESERVQESTLRVY